VFRFDPTEARAATGFVSHIVCSGTFISGLDSARVQADTLKTLRGIERAGSALRFEVDSAQRSVKSTLFGLFESRAEYHEGFGCIRLRPDERAPAWLAAGAAQQASAAKIAVPPETEILEPRFRAAIDQAFAETNPSSLRRTTAIVVLHEGRIVAERYAPGYRVDTPLLGWSVSKSVTSAFIGILVRERRLAIDKPAPVARWRDPDDPRHAITVNHLLRMASGLDLEETNREYDPVSRMLFAESDMADFAERATLKDRPGTRWQYTTGNTMILARIIRDAVGGTAGDVLAFAQRELFGPLGMRNVTIEFDVTGTPVGGSLVYASARDWARFGMLYLEDGVVGGRRVLPEGWVRYSSSRTLDSPYAAGFWVGNDAYRARWKLPADAFYAAGFHGQRVMIIPSQRLVVARFGNSGEPVGDIGFGRLMSDILEALNST
jgi:CubicO group peptidase (beta-lactamase class C family)